MITGQEVRKCFIISSVAKKEICQLNSIGDGSYLSTLGSRGSECVPAIVEANVCEG